MSVINFENMNELTNRKMVATIVLSNRQRFIRRTLNIAVASFALFMVLPVMMTVAIAIKFSSDGPVLSKQTRVCADGSTANIYKFHATNASSVGRIIRQTSIDELPKLVNVIKGDLSLVA